MDLMPKLTPEEVERARRAYEGVAVWPGEVEEVTRKVMGEEHLAAPVTVVPHAQRIAAIWVTMNDAERREYLSALAGQVGEIADTLPIDLGRAAGELAERVKGRAGARQQAPGVREAVLVLALCWAERGGPLEIGKSPTDEGCSPLLRFVAEGVRRSVPEHYAQSSEETSIALSLKEAHSQLRQLRKSGLI